MKRIIFLELIDFDNLIFLSIKFPKYISHLILPVFSPPLSNRFRRNPYKKPSLIKRISRIDFLNTGSHKASHSSPRTRSILQLQAQNLTHLSFCSNISVFHLKKLKALNLSNTKQSPNFQTSVVKRLRTLQTLKFGIVENPQDSIVTALKKMLKHLLWLKNLEFVQLNGSIKQGKDFLILLNEVPAKKPFNLSLNLKGIDEPSYDLFHFGEIIQKTQCKISQLSVDLYKGSLFPGYFLGEFQGLRYLTELHVEFYYSQIKENNLSSFTVLEQLELLKNLSIITKMDWSNPTNKELQPKLLESVKFPKKLKTLLFSFFLNQEAQDSAQVLNDLATRISSLSCLRKLKIYISSDLSNNITFFRKLTENLPPHLIEFLYSGELKNIENGLSQLRKLANLETLTLECNSDLSELERNRNSFLSLKNLMIGVRAEKPALKNLLEYPVPDHLRTLEIDGHTSSLSLDIFHSTVSLLPVFKNLEKFLFRRFHIDCLSDTVFLELSSSLFLLKFLRNFDLQITSEEYLKAKDYIQACENDISIKRKFEKYQASISYKNHKLSFSFQRSSLYFF